MPARVYWLAGTPPGVSRGLHAHKELEQVFICLWGSVRVTLDDGQARIVHNLRAGSPALHIEPGFWRVIELASAESVMLVFASAPYDPDDYIYDYKEFLEWKRTNLEGTLH